MGRYTGPVCKQCRREGIKLFLKGSRCLSGKCALQDRAYAPGQHGQGRKKLSDYGHQLREKQKTRRFYGIYEKQFHHYFDEAARQRGVTGEGMLQLLELRLDNVVFRSGIVSSRAEARQMISHCHILVNGKAVNIPSYALEAGDIVTVRERSKGFDVFNASGTVRKPPSWMSVDGDAKRIEVKNIQTREEMELPELDEQLIVEYYSR